MSLWDIIPTCDDPMSCYTVCVFAILVSGWILLATIYVRYNSNEFRRIDNWMRHEIKKLEDKIDSHDEYINDTNSIINTIQIELAVQEGSLDVIKADIGEIKMDIKKLLARN